MIINIRGTSGSGKTHTARSFMTAYQPETIVYMADGKVAAHCVYYKMMPMYVIGSYKNVCGGCDTIPTQDLVCSLVRHFSQLGHVIFEGLLISHSLNRYAELWKELTGIGIPFVFAYMSTPLDICLERVKQRRLAKGNTKELNPYNTTNTFKEAWQTKDRYEAIGIDTCIIDYEKDPVKQIRKLIARDSDLSFENSYREWTR
jgi:ABC-type dipeptide/oligopeptide/nickel transport system ATPase component